ncbi:hypothetical protein K461DRAFT_219309 [Myriangium duriaei CBS 260.36]|uniref:Tho complex subunit 7 n=1 Tax=Myriangium duriaei CBS 260.36 TaxID=1168546 RepID=A0A9P4MJL2_9PEZI|nr:hypothetical protein K461DRAFT_219309 [Myriangium duriaei CBS 260.36]
MSAADWPLLDPAEEDALHLTRLLSVDERPFQRITKRLLAKDALISKFPAQLPTPPPDATEDGDDAPGSAARQDQDEQTRQRYQDDVLLDFAQLESTLIRIQFLKDANDRERARYAEEKSKILATAESVRASTAELTIQLAEAQRSLALKKEYDELAEAIFKDKALKSRDILTNENEKLQAEIEDLRQEGRDFNGLWRERKERYDRVVDGGKSLIRFIKGEKEEDDSAEEDEQIQDGEGAGMKGDSSNVGTPRPDMGGATPMHTTDLEGDDGAHAAQQALAQRAVGSSLRVPGVDVSRSASPAPSLPTDGEGKDADMRDASATPRPPFYSDGMEEGETAEDDAANAEEKMDTT